MSQKIYSGNGSSEKIRNIIREHSPENIFLIIDKDSYSISGAEKMVNESLRAYKTHIFSDFEINPKINDIIKGVELFNNEKCDFIIGVGGGSVIDIAKAVSILATQKGNIEKIIKGEEELSDRKIPSLIIPTTAGTGSESTHFCVVYIGKNKYSLAHKSIVPDYAILDPIFTKNLPSYITATTGMDALCQGIESFWSVKSTNESREFSKKAIALSLENIINAVNKPDKNTRENMLLASNYSGKAINISFTTIAHAVSYPITSFFNIPHGHAVALTLPYFIEYNCSIKSDKIQDARGEQFIRSIMDEALDMLGVDSGLKARDKIIDIMKEIKLKTRFSEIGIFKNDLDIIIKNGFNPQRAKNNPLIVTKKDLRNILQQLL